MAVPLLPPYLENWKLQQYLNELMDDPATAGKSPETIRANIVNEAGALGLPVHADDVRVKRSDKAFKVEVLYVVHVDLAAYAVDLHFRPAAGGT
jgi:hypothetical protein